jgi:hypothetical protein
VRRAGFSQAMRLVLNQATLALAVSLGRRTGLFETMAKLPPANEAAIAGAAGLDPRYVREWLGAMVTGGIVDYDGAKGTYLLPPAHATALTDAAGADDLALALQSVTALARAEDELARCFRTGAGLSDDALDDWAGLQRERATRRQRASLVDEILPLAPGLVPRLTGGIDVLDVGGAGAVQVLLRRAFPDSRIASAPAGALAGGAEFDLVTALDGQDGQPSPVQLLPALAGRLRPRGVVLFSDAAGASDLADNVDHPLGPFLYAVSMLRPGTRLGEEQARRRAAAAGLQDIRAHRIEGDLDHVYYVATKPA